MKRKLLFTALLLLTVCTARSQDTTAEAAPGLRNPPKPLSPSPGIDTSDTRPVCFPFWMAKQIALDLEEKRRLEDLHRLDSLQLTGYRKLVAGLEQQQQHRELQRVLLQKQVSLLELQLKGEKQIRPSNGTLTWTLRLLAALGAGYLFGLASGL